MIIIVFEILLRGRKKWKSLQCCGGGVADTHALDRECANWHCKRLGNTSPWALKSRE